MSELHSILSSKNGKAYKEENIKKISLLHLHLHINKNNDQLAGQSRAYGDASQDTQARVIGKIIEVCA